MECHEVISKFRSGKLQVQPSVVRSQGPEDVPTLPADVSKSLTFAVRLLGGISGGVGVDVDLLFFQFWDRQHNLSAFYIYVGAGMGVSAKFMPSKSATSPGIWNPFSTPAAVSVGSFGRVARFTTAGCGPYTVNYLNVAPQSPTGEAIYLSLDTGTTWGLGATSTAGRLVWSPEEIMAYSGD